MAEEDGHLPATPAVAIRELRLAVSFAHGTERASDAHALGPCSIGAARAALARSVAALRAAAATATTPGNERIASIQTDAAHRREHVRTVRDTLSECRDFLRRSDPFAPAFSVVMHRVKGAAEAAGAQAVEGTAEEASAPPPYAPAPPEGPPGPLLTVCGSKFIADFQFFPRDVSVYFRHLAGVENTEIGYADVDADFVDLVRKENFTDLQRAFEVLVKQEELDKVVSCPDDSTFQLKDALRVLEEDLIAMQTAERAAVTDSEETEYRDRGIGCIKRTAQGLRIQFARGWHGFVGVEHASPPRPIISGTCGPITVDSSSESGERERALPVSFQFAQSPSVVVGGQYVLTLSEPLVASVAFAAKLERLSGSSEPVHQDGKAGSAVDSGAPTGAKTGSQRAVESGILSTSSVRQTSAARDLAVRPMMEALLAPVALGADGPDSISKSHRLEVDVLSGGDEITTAAALPGNEFLKFSYNRNDCVPGVLIHRIPLGKPHEVPPILSVLRQQIVFNALFSSCFATSDAVTAGAKAAHEQPVEVVVCDAPGFIHFGLYDSTEDTVLGVGVTIGSDGVLSAKIRGGKGKRHRCSDAKASALFKAAAYNVPLALTAIHAIGRLQPVATSAGAGLEMQTVPDASELNAPPGPGDSSIMEDVIGLAGVS